MIEGVTMPEPPEDWPVPMEAITPERLAEIELEVTALEQAVDEIERRSASMVEGMRQHYADWAGRESAPVRRPAENE